MPLQSRMAWFARQCAHNGPSFPPRSSQTPQKRVWISNGMRVQAGPGTVGTLQEPSGEKVDPPLPEAPRPAQALEEFFMHPPPTLLPLLKGLLHTTHMI